MFEMLKKIGIPATVAAVVSSLVVMIPLLFKIDERYAKSDQLSDEIKRLEQKNEGLQRELAQLTGFQQAMVTFIQEGRIPAPRQPNLVQLPPPAPVAAPAPAAAPIPRPAPPAALPPPSAAARAPASAAPGRADPSVVEKPGNWRELNEGLQRQQQRLAN